MKTKFQIVNVLLVFTLLGFIGLHYLVGHQTEEQIDDYETEISNREVIISTLKSENEIIDSNVTELSDSVSIYKEAVASYRDSLSKIESDYEDAVIEIRALSDSLTLIRFRECTTEHSGRFGFDLD